MGFYDRDYYRDEDDRRFTRGAFQGLSVTFVLILVNVLLYLFDMFLTPSTHAVTRYLAMHSETIFNPLYWYEFLTYGFVHDPSNFYHIFGNMFCLFFFGPWIERRYGKTEFFIFYLVAVVAGGLVWGIQTGLESHHVFQMTGKPLGGEMLGASGAISAVVILFACNYPKAQVFLFGILPMPAWALGVMYVVMDTLGAFNGGSNIAHTVHIAGAAVALLYFFTRIRFTSLNPRKLFSGKGSSRLETDRSAASGASTFTWRTPRRSSVPDDKLEEEVNRILDKIRISGQDSLTKEERETLIYASREYQRRQSGR